MESPFKKALHRMRWHPDTAWLFFDDTEMGIYADDADVFLDLAIRSQANIDNVKQTKEYKRTEIAKKAIVSINSGLYFSVLCISGLDFDSNEESAFAAAFAQVSSLEEFKEHYYD